MMGDGGQYHIKRAGVDIYNLSADELFKAATNIKPQAEGVYFLIHQGRVIYIGQSVNVFYRVAAHCADKVFDSWAFLETLTFEPLDLVEQYYIAKFAPLLNRRIQPRYMLTGDLVARFGIEQGQQLAQGLPTSCAA